jgi:putative FmdB family regulatory protein
MPIYDYKCERCNACFEVKQSYDDKPRTLCHLCGGEAHRLFSPVPIVFKGSGFYVTDHRAENSNIASRKDIETPTAETSVTDTKPEKKSKDKKSEKNATAGSSESNKKSEGESK